MVSEDESNLLHLAAGYRYSDAKEGFQYRTEPEFNKAPDFVDTGAHLANKTETYNAELAWRRGNFLLVSEYTQTDVDNPELGDPTFDGYYVAASWILTGEMQITTLGINWWLTPFFSVNAGYKYIINEQYGLQGKSSALLTRIVLVLE